MEWTIQDLGAVGEFIGAVGVVITLGYLAYQIRQNTAQLEQNALTTKAAAVNASNIALRETRQSLFESADMAEVADRTNKRPVDAVGKQGKREAGWADGEISDVGALSGALYWMYIRGDRGRSGIC